MELKDFIDSSEEEQSEDVETKTDETVEELAETEEEQTAEGDAENESPAEGDEAASDESDDAEGDADDPYAELVAEYGSEDGLRDALALHEKFIAGDDENQTDLVEFAKELHATSPKRYGQFVEMIVTQFAPKYGFEKAETVEETEFEDDDYTDREKALAEENARLKSALERADTEDQQTEEQQREEAFQDSLVTSLSQVVDGLGLHAEVAEDALRDAINAAVASKPFAAARKAHLSADGKRADSLTLDVVQAAQKALADKAAKYAKRSNALKVYEENQKPKSKQNAKLEEIPAARVEAQIATNFKMPPVGSKMHAYIGS